MTPQHHRVPIPAVHPDNVDITAVFHMALQIGANIFGLDLGTVARNRFLHETYRHEKA
jgi:hypothetical protein